MSGYIIITGTNPQLENIYATLGTITELESICSTPTSILTEDMNHNQQFQ